MSRPADLVQRHDGPRRVPFADHLIRDAQYGLRLLRRSPIFTTVAIVSLALGIGANAAIVQLIDTIALRRLAIVNAEQLAEVGPDGPQAFGSYDGVNSKATYPLWELIRLNPAIAIQSVELKAQIRERLTGERTIAWLAGSLGILAMVLVIVGLYGLIAYLVVSRRHEIGLRLALGSTRARIVLLVLRDNVWSTGAGLAIGLPLLLPRCAAPGHCYSVSRRPTCRRSWEPPACWRPRASLRPLCLRGVPHGSVPTWRSGPTKGSRRSRGCMQLNRMSVRTRFTRAEARRRRRPALEW